MDLETKCAQAGRTLVLQFVHVDAKIVPEQKMARFYEVHVQSTLLDNHAAVCTWGSIKNGYHRMRMIKTQSIDEAEKIAQQIIQKKTKKGYTIPPSN